jgi:23S rRNA (uracil1939-C5)-methyltransferase
LVKPRYDLQIDTLDPRGGGVGNTPEGVVSVAGALPGDRVRVRQVSGPGRPLKAVVESWDALSLQRRPPPCPVADRCGACAWMGARYAAQLAWKLKMARCTLADLAAVDSIVPAPATLGYRNRAILPFGKPPPAGRAPRVEVPFALMPPAEATAPGRGSPWAQSTRPREPKRGSRRRTERQPRPAFCLGYYEPGTHYLVDVPVCPVLLPEMNAALAMVRRAIADARPVPYNEATGRGTLRRIALRGSECEDGLLVTVVAADVNRAEPLLRALDRSLPPGFSLALNIQTEGGNAVFGAETRMIRGRAEIEERIGVHRVRLAATTFFQLNTSQAEALYRRVEALAGPTTGLRAADLYGGVGIMGLNLALAGALQVHVVESAPSALAEARRLAAPQRNLEVMAGEVHQVLPSLGPLDLVITDPPRAGLGEAGAAALLQAAPHRIIHVACSLTSLRRDLRRLLAGPYRLAGPVELFDLLPQTPHVEALVLLVRS